MEIKPCIISSERDFLALNGDFTESVKVTFPGEENRRNENNLSGWYMFERDQESRKNRFVRKLSGKILIETLESKTEYLQFDRNMGIIINAHHHTYLPVGPRSEEHYRDLKERLENVGEWKE